jgi:hypothetical protein
METALTSCTECGADVRIMPAMSPPKVVHAQEDIGLSPDNCYFDGAHKVSGRVW